MRLGKKQKDHMLTLVAQGLTSDEINRRGAKFKPPYKVSRQQVDHYRATRAEKFEEIKSESESDALRTGLALKEKRVETLSELAERLKTELLGAGDNGRLWLPRQKALGSGVTAVIVEEEHFNLTQVNALRALLDDIAQEMGGRIYGLTSSDESEDGETEDRESGESTKELRIKVEYVERNPPADPDASPRAT